jgi:hypothetical protein
MASLQDFFRKVKQVKLAIIPYIIMSGTSLDFSFAVAHKSLGTASRSHKLV